MAREYDVEAVERKWQERWRDEETYEVDNDDPRPSFYARLHVPVPLGCGAIRATCALHLR